MFQCVIEVYFRRVERSILAVIGPSHSRVLSQLMNYDTVPCRIIEIRKSFTPQKFDELFLIEWEANATVRRTSNADEEAFLLVDIEALHGNTECCQVQFFVSLISRNARARACLKILSILMKTLTIEAKANVRPTWTTQQST